MSNILLIGNINCDRVLLLDAPLTLGGRHHYHDQGRRLGGGGANTGLALIFAGHSVALVSQIGNDKTADWLLAEVGLLGFDCQLLVRNDINTPELLLLMTPDGERTIIRPQRPPFSLACVPDFSHWHALYINSSAQGVDDWANIALDNMLVVAQLNQDERPCPSHILIASKSDMAACSDIAQKNNLTHSSIWQYGQRIAGKQLRYFIVTDSENGATAYSKTEQIYTAAIKSQVIDSTGAGDAFAAGLIDVLLDGQTIRKAMQQGAHWAALAVASDSSTPGQLLKNHLADNSTT